MGGISVEADGVNHCEIGDCREIMLAYCAGVIDSDGTIGVKRSTYAMRHNNGGQATYSERVCVRQVERHAVELLKQLFGGSFGVRGANAKRGKPLYEWCVTDKRAALCLKEILPYLRIKWAQAANCLMLREHKEASAKARIGFGRGHVGASARTLEHSQLMELRYQRAKALNRVGV